LPVSFPVQIVYRIVSYRTALYCSDWHLRWFCADTDRQTDRHADRHAENWPWAAVESQGFVWWSVEIMTLMSW